MVRRLLVPWLLVVGVLAACSGGELDSLVPVEQTTTPAPQPTGTPEQPAQEPDEPEDALAAAGIDWPVVSPDEVDWPALPPAPRGFSEAELKRLAGPLRDWATRAALDPGVWSGAVRAEDILAPLGPTAGFVAAAARRSVSPRLALGNHFGKSTEVVGVPRMTSAWRASTIETARGPVLRLWLQTRTAYELEHDSGSSVVGVVREHALGSEPGARPHGRYAMAGWYEYGAAGCALVIDDALVPDTEQGADAVRTFVRLGSRPAYASPDLKEGQTVDQAYAARCTAGAPSK